MPWGICQDNTYENHQFRILRKQPTQYLDETHPSILTVERQKDPTLEPEQYFSGEANTSNLFSLIPKNHFGD